MLSFRFLIRGALALAFALVFIVPLPAANLTHRYSFTSDATDSIGGAHGTLLGGATLSGGVVQLNGSGAYVDLPNGIISAMSSVTFEVWLTDNGSAAWSRIFDFGFSTTGEGNAGTGTNYLFLTPQSGGGFLRAGIRANQLGGEQFVDWVGTRLPIGLPQHVVLTIDGAAQSGWLYVDGVLVGENPSLTFNPTQLGHTLNNWIGRSQFSADAFLDASITEFRIYDGALTATEVEENCTYGPDVAVMSGPVQFLLQPQNQSVMELSPTTFTVSFSGTPPVGIQWRRNGVNVPGATNDTCTFSAALTHHGNTYSVVLTNAHLGSPYSVTSSNAVLSVVADTHPPVLVRAASLFPNEVLVTFSEGVRADTATNTAHYAITCAGGSLAVTGARFGNTISNIILTTATQSLGTNYTLTVNNVRDRAVAANLIAPNSQATFIAGTLLSEDIGNPLVAGTLTPVAGGFDLTGGGRGIGGTSDQFTLAYQNYTNNFDVRGRVATLGFASAWTRAGLMARNGLASNAQFAAAFATPGPTGCHFSSRASVGGNATISGAFPVNYPDTWLRLRRVGNVFDSFASLDGQTWEFLGSAAISMPSVVQVGFALTAGDASAGTSAQVRDFANASGVIVSNQTLPFEPPGPSSRRTPLVITEIMYHPPNHWPGGQDLEFIEIWNSGLASEDLTGHRFEGEIDYHFPAGTRIAPGQFRVVAKDPAAALSFYGVTCLGPYERRLNNAGGALRLVNELGGRLLELEYSDLPPWPVAADGTGHSLVLTRPSYGEGDPRAWAASDRIGGSPGAFDGYGNEPARGVVINELLAHTDLPLLDYIELLNTRTQAVNLSGAWLSDTPGTNKFRLPDGTIIPARGYLVYYETELGFALSTAGEQIILVNSNQTRVLDATAFGGQENGVSVGRYPNGAPGFQRLATRTPGTANSAPRPAPVVINEIMYNPISGSDDDEYVEMHNPGTNAISLAGWELQDGIGYTFPSNVIIAPGGYVVVARNAANLIAKYPQLNATNTYGNYSGRLSNSGERIALAMPDFNTSTNSQGVVTTNVFTIVVSEVTYFDGGRWGEWSDGWGSSLELTDPRADPRRAANWADSDETAKAPWTTINVTAILENGQTAAMVNQGSYQGAANRFEFFLQGKGEVLVDNLEFRNNGGANLLGNGTFNSGATGWVFGGVMRGSFVQSGVGLGGTPALRVMSTARGDTGPNKARATFTSTVVTNSPKTGTIRASVRWLRGTPHIMFRTRGHWMEVPVRLNVPETPGTPGLPNSRRVANAGPAIFDVAHAPVLPAAGQPVVVSARASDPDGMATVQLKYRVDANATYTTLNMTNDQGLFRATIPGQASGMLVAFVVSASDTLAAASQFPTEAPGRECLVRWGETVRAGSIGTYRLWVTSSNVTFWTNREKNAKDAMDATFVYGNHRVIYNVDTMYSGSPFHAPNNNGPLGSFACDYDVAFRPDESLLGAESFTLTAFDVTSGNFFHNDLTAQIDLTGNWIARKLGQPSNYRRHIHMVVNGLVRGTIYDDAQQPNSDFVDMYFPEDDGQLRKIEDWFEFANNTDSGFGVTTATLVRHNRSDGEIDTKRYRWNWRPRATRDHDDWSPLMNLVATMNNTASPNYLARVQTWIDVPNFMRPIVTRHICGDWDSYGYERGKNMYAYKPQGRPWRLLVWDIELALGSQSRPATDSIYNIQEPALLSLILNNPPIHREYLRGYHDALSTALAPGAVDVALDERYANFQQNGVPLASPQSIKNYLTARRLYLQGALPAANFAVNNPAYQVVSGSNVLAVTGSAPLDVETILVNGNAYAVTWTGVTVWRVLVPLSGGTNVLEITATDRAGNVISNATGSVTANYTGVTVAPEGRVVINEIMYQPAAPGAAYLELFNTHSNYTFDLSGWRVNGLGYTFPPGATMAPRSNLVLAEDPTIYSETYGLDKVAFDRYGGRLDDTGETLTLFRPGAQPDEEIVVNRVRYAMVPPWPAPADGVSLQLVDAAQDNSRVGNWATGSRGAVAPQTRTLLNHSGVWKFMQVSNLNAVNWTAPAFNHGPWPSGPGLFGFENNPAIVPLIGTTLKDPRIGTNGMLSGHACYFRTTVNVTGSLAGFTITASAYVDDGAVFYVNGVAAHRLRMPAGTVLNNTLASALPPGDDAINPDLFPLPASLFVPGTNVIAVSVHQFTTNSSDIVFGLRLDAEHAGGALAQATPGATNSVAATLPPFLPLWLNEIQADNVTGPTDNFGQHEPWVELFNPGPNALSLNGWFLANNYTNLAQWAFPVGTSIPAGGFLVVWCDNEPHQTAPGALHTNFRLPSGTGRVALSRQLSGTNQLVDYLNYANLPANWSYGDLPDAQPFYRSPMFFPTPGALNSAATPTVTLFVNEWLAANSGTLANPLNGVFDDWFELYNPGMSDVDLSNYYLTDNLNIPTKFRVPNTGQYVVPAGGYLLIWADNNQLHNNPERPELHVNFALSRAGEALAVSAPDGTLLDAVVFGPQETDISQGRFPDGAANVYSMPTPTPGQPNVIPNTPPVLAAISNRVVTLGQTISFIANATDAEAPPQVLAFSLLSAPAGTQIHPASGLFTWTPTLAPAINTLSVVVTDNGVPNLSATQSFSVVSAPVPVLGGYAMNGNLFTFSWNTYAGQRFRVEFKDDLNAATWLPMSGALVGTGGVMTFTNIVDEAMQRYFRLRVLP